MKFSFKYSGKRSIKLGIKKDKRYRKVGEKWGKMVKDKFGQIDIIWGVFDHVCRVDIWNSFTATSICILCGKCAYTLTTNTIHPFTVYSSK